MSYPFSLQLGSRESVVSTSMSSTTIGAPQPVYRNYEEACARLQSSYGLYGCYSKQPVQGGELSFQTHVKKPLDVEKRGHDKENLHPAQSAKHGSSKSKWRALSTIFTKKQ